MALVVVPLVDSADAGHCEQEISLRQVEDAVLAGAAPHGCCRHLVEDRLQPGGTGDGTKHAADRVLLLAESLVAPGELLYVERLRPVHEADFTTRSSVCRCGNARCSDTTARSTVSGVPRPESRSDPTTHGTEERCA
jgi:hypothetical protein